MKKTGKAAAQLQGDLKLLETFWERKPERRVLGNGVTVVVQRDGSAPLASAQVWVKSGSVHEGKWLGAGVSHFLEHMLFKGTVRRSAQAISQEVQAHGGMMNAYTSFDRTVYHVDLPAEHCGVALDVLADMVLCSSFPEEEVARERDVILREIDMCRDDADQRLWERLFETAFRTHPFRFPIIGHREVFAALSREDLLEYYRARYAPDNLAVIVTGDVDTEAVFAEVEKLFGKAPRRSVEPVLVPEEPAQIGARRAHFFEDVELTRGALAWPVGGFTHGDSPALGMLALLLGGGDSSLLWRELRERKRLVHSIDASCWNPGSSGLFCVTFTCDAEKRAEVEREVGRQLVAAAERGFSEGEIAKALRQLVAGEIGSRRTVAGQASRLGVAELVAGNLEFGRAYFEKVAGVGNADLMRVAGEYLRGDLQSSVSLNPKGAGQVAVADKLPSAAEGVEVVTLENGARVVLQRNGGLPCVHFRFLCEGGALWERGDLRGSTGLLATLLTRDTERRSAAEVAAVVEGAGGSFFPFSGNNSFGLGVEVLRGDEDLALGVLEDAVLRPRFTEESFETEREAQLADLRQDADDVVVVGRKFLRERFFGGYPLGVEPVGREGDLRSLRVGDLEALRRRLVVAGNVVVSVCGDFEREGLLGKLRAFLDKLPSGKLEGSGEKFAGVAEAGAFVERMDREQAVVYLGFEGTALRDGDFFAGEVLDELFSGMSSRLFERVREEKGLAYFVRSGRVTGLEAGMFMFYAGTSPASAREVIGEIWAEIERVKSGGVSEEELRRCKVRLKAGKMMALQTNSARAMHMGLNALYGLEVDDRALYGERVDAVSVGDLSEFARRRFVAERAVEVTVGKVEGGLAVN